MPENESLERPSPIQVRSKPSHEHCCQRPIWSRLPRKGVTMITTTTIGIVVATGLKAGPNPKSKRTIVLQSS